MNKKMKFVAIMATLLIAAAGVITFEACNKKDSIITNQETLTRESTPPIALNYWNPWSTQSCTEMIYGRFSIHVQ